MSLKILKFKHPFTCIVAGPTFSGKTTWVRKFLTNWKYIVDNISVEKEYLNVLWCHGQSQDLHQIPIDNVTITYVKGFPSTSDLEQMKPDMVVLDDLMNELKNNQEMKNLFTKTAHHSGISVIYIVQNIFHQDKAMRDISLNTHYVVAMRGPRMTRQLGAFAEQIFPKSSTQLMSIYKDATVNKFSYLLFDLHPMSEEKFCIRTRIFKDELTENLSTKFDSVPIFYEISKELK